MSEAESRSGPDYDEVNKKVVLSSNVLSPELLEWTSSRTRPVQLGQSQQQCLSSPSPKPDPRCSPFSEAVSPVSICTNKSPVNNNLSPSPSHGYAIPTIQTPKCTENNTSASPKSIQITSSPSFSSNNNSGTTTDTTTTTTTSAKHESSQPIQVSEQSTNEKHGITTIKSDSEVEGESKKSHNHTSQHKKSQEVPNNSHSKNIRLPDIKNPKSHHRSRKEAGIPVGIAVAWQRLVTSAASLTTTTSSTTSTSTMSSASSPNPTTPTLPKSSSSAPNKIKVPQRPSSASPILPKSSSKDDKRICRTNSSNGEHAKLSGAELTVPSRPLPSSSVPPSNSVNLLANHLGNYLDHRFPYGDSIGYNSPTHLHTNHTHYADWQSNLMVPHFSQGYNAAAVYMQQQQQHQQLSLQQLHLSNHGYNYPVSSYMYAGYPPESLHQFEQFLHQQQQSDLLRHHQQQQHHHQHQQQQQQQLLLRQQAEYEMQRPTPIPSPSPRLSIPAASPSPTTPSLLNSPSLSLSNHGARATTPLPTNWSDLYHHNSSTALSPKSLTSSTPSPVTVHDFNLGFNITLSRKCATPNSLSPANITTITNSGNNICGGGSGKSFPFSSPFSPSLFPSKDVWKDVKKISPGPLKRKKSAPTGDIRDSAQESCEKEKDNENRGKQGLRNGNFNGTDVISPSDNSINSSSKSNKFPRTQSEALVVVKVEPREIDVDVDVEEEGRDEEIKIPLPTKVSVSGEEEEEGLDIVKSPCANTKGLNQTETTQEQLLKISKKHDFKRLESLIEKRADESVPLLTHSHSSEDSEPEVHSTTPKKAKLELPEESDNGNVLLPTSTSSTTTTTTATTKSISTCTANTKAAILSETEMERFSPGKATFQADLANLSVNVKIKREKVEESEKYNDTCQNFETVPQTYIRAIKEESSSCSSINLSQTRTDEDEGDLPGFNVHTRKLNPTVENGEIGEKKHLLQKEITNGTVNALSDTSCNGLGKVSLSLAHSHASDAEQEKRLEREESEFSKIHSLKICNELKTHDDCDFDCVDGGGMEKRGKVVPESNLPFSSSFKGNNNRNNNSKLEEPISTNENSCKNICNGSSSKKLLESIVTLTKRESSKMENVLVGVAERCEKITAADSFTDNYFDSSTNECNNSRESEKSYSVSTCKTTNVCGIAVKIREDDENCNGDSSSRIINKFENPGVRSAISDDSSETEVIIRIKDGKSYLEDEDENIDATNDENNQYGSLINGNNDISTYSSQTQHFANNISSSRDSNSDSIRDSSSSILMTSESDADDCLPTKIPISEQMIYANQFSFNKTLAQAQPESIYHNRITPEDYSLNHNLISVKTSETGVCSTPDAPQVSSSDPPVTLCYLSPHPLPVQIISPQNIKIPSYVPTSGGYTESEDGEKKYTTTVLYQQTQEPFSMYSYGSPLASPPFCDKDITTPGDDILQLRQRILPIENQQTMQIRRNSFYISPDTCIKPEDNHLDLLATVAQEFGRSDLVKVSNCLSIGSSSTCLTPTSLQTIVNTSSTSNSIYSRTTDVLQPVPAVTNVYPEPVPATHSSSSKKLVADMFEFRSEDEDAFLKTQPMESKGYISSLIKKNQTQNTNLNLGNTAYQPVLLKIPHIVPKAAASAAEKLKKAKLRQEKAKEKNTEKIKKITKKEKDTDNTIPGAGVQLSPKVKINNKSSKEKKPCIDIPINNKLDDKIKIPKVKLHNIAEGKKVNKGTANQKDSSIPIVKNVKKEKSENQTEGKVEKKVTKKAVLKKETENETLIVTKPKIKKIKKISDTMSKSKVLENEMETKGNTKPEKIFSPKQKRPSGSAETGKEKDKTKIKSENRETIRPSNEENASLEKSLNNSDLNYCSPKEKDKEKGKTSNKRNKTVVNRTNNGSKTATAEKDSPPKKKRKPSSKLKPSDLADLVTLSVHQQTQSGKLKPAKCIPMLSPSNVENEIANVHINVNVDRDRENEFDWEANPTYAVTAIKMSNGTNKICCESTATLDCTEKSEKKERRKSSKPSKLTLLNSHNQTPTELSESEKILKVKSQLKSFVHFAPRRIQNGHSHGTLPNRRHSSSSTTSRHIKPCLKAQPIVRPMSEKEDSDDSEIDLEVATLTRSISSSALNTTNNSSQSNTINNIKKKAQQHKDRMTNVFSRKIDNEEADKGNDGVTAKENSKLASSSSTSPSGVAEKAAKVEKRGRRTSSSASAAPPKSIVNGKVEIENVTEMLDEMRILTEIQGLFYTGKLNALQPPDVYGVTLDNERGAPPHIIFSAEEVLEKCIREVKPCQLKTGLRICAYWSPQYSGLYPGKVSLDYSPNAESDLIPIEFDDGDTGVIKVGEIRLLATNHPIREYDPNPLLTLEKKHRKRRHSSTNGTSGVCTGDHEDADCGEPYCAKLAKLEEEEKDDHRSSKLLYWTWTGLGYKIPKTKKYRHKEFFRGIQRGDEVINVGDSALFISNGNDRPFIGRVERFWEKKGRKIVNVKWFYHPEEVETGKRLHGMKYAGALFESPHIDENDVQTIAKKCEVLPFKEFKERVGGLPKLSKNASPKDIYYIAGYYNPYTFKLKINDLK